MSINADMAVLVRSEVKATGPKRELLPSPNSQTRCGYSSRDAAESLSEGGPPSYASAAHDHRSLPPVMRVWEGQQTRTHLLRTYRTHHQSSSTLHLMLWGAATVSV